MTTPRLCQSDPEWAAHLVGLSPKVKYSAAACLLCEIAEAQIELEIDAHATPVKVQAAAIAAWRLRGSRQDEMPFIALPLVTSVGRQPGANVVYDAVCAAARLKVGPRLDLAKVGADGLRFAIGDALNSRGRVLMHVDTDASDADFNGKHWVLALRVVGDALIYSDPAIGREAALPTSTLEGKSGWQSGRIFAVRGIRTLHRLPAIAA